MNTHANRETLMALVNGYTIRGQTDKSFDCPQAMMLARAFGDFLAPGDGTLAIGHDMRASSAPLAEAVSLGLRSGGHHVTHIGSCTTPALEWYIDEEELDGGIMITAGCLAAEYNGLRFYGPRADPVRPEQVVEVGWIQKLDALFQAPCNSTLRYDRPLPHYAAWLRQPLREVNGQVKLAIDAANGGVAVELEEVLAHFPNMLVERIGFSPDPSLSRRPLDPLSPQAQTETSQRVKARGCALGAVLDVDGDRLAVIDERGQPADPYAIGILLAEERAKSRTKLQVLHAESAPAFVDAALHRLGVKAEKAPGTALSLWHRIHDVGAVLYFDDRGHYSYSDFPGSANALLALFRLIKSLSKVGQPLSERVAAVQQAD